LQAHQNPDSQVIFPIIQGGLYPEWRAESVKQLLARSPFGIAIGGLRFVTRFLLAFKSHFLNYKDEELPDISSFCPYFSRNEFIVLRSYFMLSFLIPMGCS